MKFIGIIILLFCFSACQTTIPNRNPLGQTFPKVTGKSLKGEKFRLPKSLSGEFAILLIGYDQDSQFDIDRWILGLTDHKVKTPVFEIPTIKGFATFFASSIDQGMRDGIPSSLWSQVVTVYDDSEKIVNFTGNQFPRNTRVIVLNPYGKTVYFYDQGYSIPAVKELLTVLPKKDFSQCSSS